MADEPDPTSGNRYDDQSSGDGNSIDEFIKNDYNCPDISDSEYLSDDSLKVFLKQLSQQKDPEPQNIWRRNNQAKNLKIQKNSQIIPTNGEIQNVAKSPLQSDKNDEKIADTQ